MKKRKIIISLAAAASLAFNTISFEASADRICSGEWKYTRYYDENGSIYVGDLSYTGADTEIFIPESIDGEPVKSLDLFTFFESDVIGSDDTITIHIPDDLEVEDMTEFFYYYPDAPDIILMDSEGNEELIKRHFDEVDYMWKYDESCWKYNILDSLEGVCDEPCVEITAYNGKRSQISVPPMLGGYPVVRISDTVFNGKSTHERVSLEIPTDATIYSQDGERIDKTNCNIQLAEGCLNGMYNIDVVFGFCFYTQNTGCYINDDQVYHISGNKNGEYSCHLQAVNNHEFEDPCVIRSEVAGIPVTAIESNAFRVSGPFDLELPETITDFSNESFMDSAVSSLNIPENVKILPEKCFYNCTSLKEIKGIDHVQIIADNVFFDKETIHFDYLSEEENQYYDTLFKNWDSIISEDDMVHFNYNISDWSKPFIATDIKTGYAYRIYRNSDNTLSAELIYAPCENVVIPKEFHGIPVKAALKNTLPKGAKLIIPKDMKEISYYDIDFYHDDFFANRKYSLDVDSGSFSAALDTDSSYQRNAVKEVDIYSDDIYIKSKAFTELRFPSLSFPGSARLGQGFCTGNFMLKKMEFNGTEAKIKFDDRACEGLNFLEELVFPEKCDDLIIGMSAFGSCGIKELVIPDGTSAIGNYAFQQNSRLTSVTINGSPEIGEHAFMKCPKLKEVKINGKPKLKHDAFNNCRALENVEIDMSAPFDGSAFNNCPNLNKINGISLFDEDGTPKEKYREFIEKNFKDADNNGIINDYTMYRIRQTVAETVDDSMTDLQKIKAIHDKICSMVNYDNDDKSNLKNHTDVSIFLNETSVCEGYARAMNLMLHEAGVESQYVRTDDHAWVIVKVGDHCFHVDPTWDDDGDTISYDWFMKNDEQIYGKDSHLDWVVDTPSKLHEFQNSKMYECTSLMGDVNGNGVVDAVDASAILKAYARMSVDGTRTIDKVLADYNFDGRVTAVDASLVLTEYANESVEK